MNPRRRHSLVLPVQRQVVHELVDQQPRQDAHVRQALLQHRGRRRRAHQLSARLLLPHLPDVAEHHVRCRSLGQPVGRLGAHPLVRGGTHPLRRRDRDLFHRHRRIEAKGLGVALGRGAGLAALVGSHRLGGRGDDLLGELSQQQLPALRVQHPPLRLLSEQLALEPRHLPLHFGQLRRQLPVRFGQGAVLGDHAAVGVTRGCRGP